MRIATGSKSLLLLVSLVAWPIVGAWQASTAPRGTIETLSLCKLTKDWKKYDHKTVRIEAVYATGPESSQVYDIACPNSEAAWVPPDLAKMAPADMVEKMSRLLRSSGRVRIVATGEFDGPKKVDIPPGTSPGLAQTLQAADSHYGHQNGWDFQFVFSKIEKVEPVPASDPWPRWATEKRSKITGKERDSEGGLDNFGARYNSSGMGRFMSPDWSSDPDPIPSLT